MSEPQRHRTGYLSGDGARTVRVCAYRPGGPPRPPDDLADVVEPVPDLDGVIRDFRLRSPLPDGTDVAAVVNQLVAWRRGFATDRVLWAQGLLDLALEWLAHRVDVGPLQSLRLDFAVIDAERTRRLLDAVHRVRRAEWGRSEQASVLRDAAKKTNGAGHSAPFRSVVTDDDRLLAADHAVAVHADRDGLWLRADVSGATPERVRLRGWRRNGTGLLLDADDGSRELADPAACAVIEGLGRHVAEVEVGRVPVRSALEPMLVWVEDVARDATANRTGLVVRAL